MKLIIIDDNIDYATCIKYILEKEGFDVFLLNKNFYSFKEIVNNIKPNLILMDIELNTAGLNGKALSLTLKKNPETADIPIIALTCLNSKSKIKEIMTEGLFNAFISKDSDNCDLISLVNIYCKKV